MSPRISAGKAAVSRRRSDLPPPSVLAASSFGTEAASQVKWILDQLLEQKALDLIVIHVAPYSSVADFLVVAGATSNRHAQSIVENIDEALRRAGRKNHRLEGLEEGRWVVLDTGDVVLHVFLREPRLLYDLEGLWSMAPQWPGPEFTPPDEARVPRKSGRRRATG